ncbi:M1 family metallopeptidase [Fluviicola taffensis]|uniref:Peptidase M1 membrane alanine aminopeptidase n=1 Tax=Fluviicola taffensis (strain DSM 16823 / NCIMB 13979 / RW262) TaxID=755732 RepID=F2IBU4_FLUTR|nr:M1 family metallopeptidase [Fluviicola taffensis]AEA42172.1 Peptidase M1 membrane alanine aminopeptidase [Fluviicola taffensis DSM 16823]
MRYLLILLLIISESWSYGQFSHADSIRGHYGSSRNWWDLKHYDLSVTFDIDKKEIHGKNVITFSTEPVSGVYQNRFLQIDLQDPMVIDSVILSGWFHISLEDIKQDGNAYFIPYQEANHKQKEDTELTIYFHGKPRIAKRAPWDGGIIWSKDPNGKPWITIACQGLGASVWFPCKDSQFDEPDNGVTMHYTCPSYLVCVSNGLFVGKEINNMGQSTYSWKVSNPINNYCMIPYVGDYVNMHEHFAGEKGSLEIDYWVLRGNEEKAKKHFQDAPKTLKAFEYWFGPYPFYEDGYKLVEAPHLGMEHQSAVAYGNGFKNGYMGTDLSGTGIGLKWDFIIVHESGHEWFGNNITSKDIADMWIHEAFTCYSETLFTDYWFGKEDADTYCQGLRKNIKNDKPIIGPYTVNTEGSGDMYYKGANMLHTIRTIYGNDSLFRVMLRKMNATFYHQTVTTQQIEQFMSKELGMNLTPIFEQYLRTKKLPTLQLKYSKKKVKYRWVNCVAGFNMPIMNEKQKLVCTSKWNSYSIEHDYSSFELNKNLYVLKKESKKE